MRSLLLCVAVGVCLSNASAAAQAACPATVSHTRYLAEGATSPFFATMIALANGEARDLHVRLRFQTPGHPEITQCFLVPAQRQTSINVGDIAGLAEAEFATVIESDGPVISDRRVTWGGGYGSHAETSIAAPATKWYFAEGATNGPFNLFYLLQNPSPTTSASVTVRYLLPDTSPLEKTYTLPPGSRQNIWVDVEEFPNASGKQLLANTAVSAVVEVTNGVPIVVERSMYFDRPGQQFAAGHNSAGVLAPQTRWLLAEGATGPYFDLFVLVANPGEQPAALRATYLLPDGTTLEKHYVAPPRSRQNIWVDLEEFPEGSGNRRLADTAVSIVLESTNGIPVVVERAMWWPGDSNTWNEGHNSFGAAASGPRWGIADGEAGGVARAQTYVLVANTSVTAARVRVTVLRENSAPLVAEYDVQGSSRFNIPVGEFFPQVQNSRFGVVVESVGALPAQLVVERSIYSDAGTVAWAAGANALAMQLAGTPDLALNVAPPAGWQVSAAPWPDTLHVYKVAPYSTEDALSEDSPIQVRRRRNANRAGLGVDAWFDTQYSPSAADPITARSNITIDGRQSLRVEVEEIERFVHIYVPDGTDIVEIAYPVRTTALMAHVDGILASLKIGASVHAVRAVRAFAGAVGADPVGLALGEVGDAYVKYGKGKAAGPNGEDQWDCSELVRYIYPELPDGSANQEIASVGTRLSGGLRDAIQNGSLKRGDLLFFDTTKDGVVDHVGVYDGAGQIIHAFNPVRGVVSDDLLAKTPGLAAGYYENRFVSARRVRDLAPQIRRVTITLSGPGQVRIEPAGQECASSCTVEFSTPGSIRLVAMPHVDAEFGQWSGACSGKTPCILTMNADHAVSAVFTPGCTTCVLTTDFTAESHQGFGWLHRHTLKATLMIGSVRLLVVTGTTIGTADDPMNPYSPSTYQFNCTIPLAGNGAKLTGVYYPCYTANAEGTFTGTLSVDENGKKIVTGKFRVHNLFIPPWTLSGYEEDTGEVPLTLRP